MWGGGGGGGVSIRGTYYQCKSKLRVSLQPLYNAKWTELQGSCVKRGYLQQNYRMSTIWELRHDHNEAHHYDRSVSVQSVLKGGIIST